MLFIQAKCEPATFQRMQAASNLGDHYDTMDYYDIARRKVIFRPLIYHLILIIDIIFIARKNVFVMESTSSLICLTRTDVVRPCRPVGNVCYYVIFF